MAQKADGQDMYVLGENDSWAVHVRNFIPKVKDVPFVWSWTVVDQSILAVGQYGELCLFDRDGNGRLTRQLDNFGYQAISSFAPADKGTKVYAGPFINSSLLELDIATGQGRNIRPVQEHGGQVNCIFVHKGTVYMACYAGGSISAFDPSKPVDWPNNPRHVCDLGQEQMRPGNDSVRFDGRYFWFCSHARYTVLGGAIVRFDPETETCKVWRNLVQDHNPSRLCLSLDNRCVLVGTGPDPDTGSGPPAETPAAVFVFDTTAEKVQWVVRPLGEKVNYYVPKLITPAGDILTFAFLKNGGCAFLLLDPDTGEVRRELEWPATDKLGITDYFRGPDNRLYATAEIGLYHFDLESGVGEQMAECAMRAPWVRGNDLFFLQDHCAAGMIIGLWSRNRR